MADTPWQDFPDVTSLQDTDILLALRGAGGINFPASLLVRYNSPGGSVGIGTSSPGAKLDVVGQVRGAFSSGAIIASNGSGSGQTSIYLRREGAPANQKTWEILQDGIGRFSLRAMNDAYSAAGTVMTVDRGTDANTSAIQFFTSNALRLLMNDVDVAVNANLVPNTDNSRTLGWAGGRFTTVFATTGSINTSDEREKLWITIAEDRRAKDQRIARAIFDELGWFQWKDAVAEKGEDGARWHFGPRAQRVWQIVADEGLAPPLVGRGSTQRPAPEWHGPPPPAWLCFDEWPEERAEEPVYSEKLLGPDEKPLQTGTREVVIRKAGNRFGLRVDQLGLLLDWSLHERLTILEAA